MIVDVGESCGSTQKNVESCSKKKIRTWKAGARAPISKRTY